MIVDFGRYWYASSLEILIQTLDHKFLYAFEETNSSGPVYFLFCPLLRENVVTIFIVHGGINGNELYYCLFDAEEGAKLQSTVKMVCAASPLPQSAAVS